jgi:hypothetical protein
MGSPVCRDGSDGSWVSIGESFASLTREQENYQRMAATIVGK